ncbi:hypothetical protein, partial [Mycobacterium avium]
TPSLRLSQKRLSSTWPGGHAVKVVPATHGPHDHDHNVPEPPTYITDIPGMQDDGQGGVYWIPGNGMVF